MHAFRSILLAVTHLHTSDLELKQAFRLASDNRARLIIAMFDNSLETMRKLQFLPLEKKLEQHLKKQLEEELAHLKALAWDEGVKAETLIVSGRPRLAMYSVLEQYHIDLVIKLADTSGGLTRNQLTGNDLAILRKCPVPVLMMADRDQAPGFTGKVMVAVDAGDPDIDAQELNSRLIRYGIYLAAQEQAELHIVSVWNLAVGKRSLQTFSDEELYELQEITRKRHHHKIEKMMVDVGVKDSRQPVPVEVHVLKGKPSVEIQKLANMINVDFIVMGTLGRQRKGILIGNTAENILNSVYCSILAIKPSGYVSSVVEPHEPG